MGRSDAPGRRTAFRFFRGKLLGFGQREEGGTEKDAAIEDPPRAFERDRRRQGATGGPPGAASSNRRDLAERVNPPRARRAEPPPVGTGGPAPLRPTRRDDKSTRPAISHSARTRLRRNSNVTKLEGRRATKPHAQAFARGERLARQPELAEHKDRSRPKPSRAGGDCIRQRRTNRTANLGRRRRVRTSSPKGRIVEGD